MPSFSSFQLRRQHQPCQRQHTVTQREPTRLVDGKRGPWNTLKTVLWTLKTSSFPAPQAQNGEFMIYLYFSAHYT